MPSARKAVPEFRSEAEERAFWEEHDSADYLDWSRAEAVLFTNLRPSTSTISLRLPAQLLADLKVPANRRDVPYQSLLKVYLAERIAAESAKALPGNLRDVLSRLRPPRAARGSRRGVTHDRAEPGSTGMPVVRSPLSRTSRTFADNCFMLNGFCRNGTSSSLPSDLRETSAEYPEAICE